MKQNIEKTAELEAKAAKLDAERNGYQEEVAEIKDDLAKQQVQDGSSLEGEAWQISNYIYYYVGKFFEKVNQKHKC